MGSPGHLDFYGGLLLILTKMGRCVPTGKKYYNKRNLLLSKILIIPEKILIDLVFLGYIYLQLYVFNSIRSGFIYKKRVELMNWEINV